MSTSPSPDLHPSAQPILPAIACIGGGNMGAALLKCLQQQDPLPALTVIDPSPQVAERFAGSPVLVSSEPAAVSTAQVIILAVKPQMGELVAAQLRPHLRPEQLVISILAGTTLSTLSSWFPDNPRLIRAMPNTPMAIGEGMVGLAPLANLDATSISLATHIFSVAAKVIVIQEDAMDALTAVSGSGPAYVFRFAEGLFSAAIAMGFSAKDARTLVSTTLRGSVNYLLSQIPSDRQNLDGNLEESPEDIFPAARLRQQVTSPGGTTAAALAVLDAHDFVGIIGEALQAARARSQQLAQA